MKITKRKVVAVVAIAFGLVANLQYAFTNYGMGEFNLSMPLIAQTNGETNGGTNGDTNTGGTNGGGSNGGSNVDFSVPTACPEATITNLKDQRNNAQSCSCTASYNVLVSSSPWKVDVKYVSFQGIRNTCKSGSSSQTCDAFACSSTQTGGGTSQNPD
jgi:hypothetical protein